MTVNDNVDALPDKTHAEAFYAKYEPMEILGRGMSSVVRRCIKKINNESYAVKIIDLQKSNHPQDLESMHIAISAEVAALKVLNPHDNIIQLEDVFQTQTYVFLVFELASEGELFDMLTKLVVLSEKKARLIMAQIFQAVSHMHELNILHRDLKPENILLSDNMVVKISDFGFARVFAENEVLTELCGTPAYLAPEMLHCNAGTNPYGYGKEIDLWACGVILYTLLIGRPPFWHRRQLVMLRAIMDGNYTLETPEWDDVSDSAKDLISKLLVVNPRQRITANEALKHAFFGSYISKDLKPRKFKVAAIVVRTIFVFINLLRAKYGPVPFSVIQNDPYGVRPIRKLIDSSAFTIYGHWVKRSNDQNRGALFENTLRAYEYANDAEVFIK